MKYLVPYALPVTMTKAVTIQQPMDDPDLHKYVIKVCQSEQVYQDHTMTIESLIHHIENMETNSNVTPLTLYSSTNLNGYISS